MIYVSSYISPVGKILLAEHNTNLIGLWIGNQENYLCRFNEPRLLSDNSSVLTNTKKWLDEYFAGTRPNPNALPLNPIGTEFQRKVWRHLLEIPYGKTVSYKALALKIESETGRAMASQAIGGAVGRNPISIIIPCHRVIGSNGNLVGYAVGLNIKEKLLNHEMGNL